MLAIMRSGLLSAFFVAAKRARPLSGGSPYLEPGVVSPIQPISMTAGSASAATADADGDADGDDSAEPTAAGAVGPAAAAASPAAGVVTAAAEHRPGGPGHGADEHDEHNERDEPAHEQAAPTLRTRAGAAGA